MIIQTKTCTCARCGSTNLVRNGKNRVGNPRYKCKDCQYCGVLKSRRASEAFKQQAVAMAQERSSLRGIGRVMGCSASSVSNMLRPKFRTGT